MRNTEEDIPIEKRTSADVVVKFKEEWNWEGEQVMCGRINHSQINLLLKLLRSSQLVQESYGQLKHNWRKEDPKTLNQKEGTDWI